MKSDFLKNYSQKEKKRIDKALVKKCRDLKCNALADALEPKPELKPIKKTFWNLLKFYLKI